MKHSLPFPSCLLAGLLCLLTATTSRGVVYQYENSTQWLYHNSIPQTPGYLTPFADPGKFAIGQVFAPPDSGLFLETAGLWISRSVALSDISLSIYFAEWNSAESRVDGPIHTFTGVDYAYSPQPSSGLSDYSRVDFNTTHVPLTAGQDYILFMTAAPFAPDVAAGLKFGYEQYDGYWGHAWSLDGTALGDASQKAWNPYDGNLIIQVQFNSFEPPLSPVPEPSTYGAAASGMLLALACFRRYRRRAQPLAAVGG